MTGLNCFCLLTIILLPLGETEFYWMKIETGGGPLFPDWKVCIIGWFLPSNTNLTGATFAKGWFEYVKRVCDFTLAIVWPYWGFILAFEYKLWIIGLLIELFGGEFFLDYFGNDL